MRAVRLRPNVVVPNVVVGADRVVAVGPAGRTVGKWTDSLRGKLAAVQRAIGVDEGQFRDRLRQDAQLSEHADAEFPEPSRSVTPSEAALLIERGLADPVFDQ
jgi:hypothetical protein